MQRKDKISISHCKSTSSWSKQLVMHFQFWHYNSKGRAPRKAESGAHNFHLVQFSEFSAQSNAHIVCALIALSICFPRLFGYHYCIRKLVDEYPFSNVAGLNLKVSHIHDQNWYFVFKLHGKAALLSLAWLHDATILLGLHYTG